MIARLALAAALLLGAVTVTAQERSLFTYPVAGNAPACDVTSRSYEGIGGTTSVSSGSTVNAESGWVGIGTTASELDELQASVVSGTSGYRGLVDVAIGDGVTPLVDDAYFGGISTSRFRLPVAVPAGSALKVRFRSATSGATVSMALIGRTRGANCPAGTTRVEALDPDTASTRAGSVEVTLNAASPTQLIASTARAFSGVVLSGGTGTNAPTNTQPVTVTLFLGPAGAEVPIGRIAGFNTSQAAIFYGGTLFTGAIPGGQRLSATATAAIGGDSIRVQVLGVY